MSHTRTAVDVARARIAKLPRAFMRPSVSESEALVQRLGVVSTAVRPAQDALKALYGRLRTAFLTGNATNVRGRDLRNAPWVLWDPATKAASIHGLLDAIVAQAQESDRTTRNLIEAWLRAFSEDEPSIVAAGHAIKRLLRHSTDSRLEMWREADRRFDLFNAKQGPKSLAWALVTGTDEVNETIGRVGLDDPIRSTSGFMRATMVAVLESVPNTLRSGSADRGLQRMLAFFAPAGGLRFDKALHGIVGKGLLRPWLDRGREPTPSHRDLIREFLLKHVGDPRLRASNWTAIGDAEIALMRGWLARASLKAFFSIVAEHALDRHWRYRDAFWSAYLEKGAIDDAWLALGRDAHASARSIRDLSGGFGRLDGAASDQSVLLLRIGPLILSEWSHNGALRAWLSSSRATPELHRHSYHRGDLIKRCLVFPSSTSVVAVPPWSRSGGLRRLPTVAPSTALDEEIGRGLSHVGNWQSRAAELIAREAKVRIAEDDWIPR